ncbi:MAG TPA: EamA family transporter [Terracidiphilus sp.]|nr:EamA family transporter [Terracidiphilus sp.]
MAVSHATLPQPKAAARLTIVLAFASVYIFWGSTYTAISIARAHMPAFALAGIRFTISGVLLLAWCRVRGLKLLWPPKTMLVFAAAGLLLLACGNAGLVYAEKLVPSGLSSLVYAVIPLYVALIEMFLPHGEALPRRGWVGVILGFAGLVLLVWPSMHSALAGDRGLLWAYAALFGGAFSWTIGSLVTRHAKVAANSFVAASWQMLIAGVFCLLAGTALGEWSRIDMTPAVAGSLAYLVVCGSLLGYTSFIYLLEHLPAAKVLSYAYVNPVVAVLLGIVLLGERPAPAEFAGMAAIVLAVFLLTTAKMRSRNAPRE